MPKLRVIIRHLCLAVLPLAAGIGAGWGFVALQGSCTDLVGLLLAPMCRGRQYQYQILAHLWGTAGGCAVAACLGIWLELRRLRRSVAGREPPAPPAV